MKRAIIGVSGGVAFEIKIPEGMEVEIWDYDVLPEDNSKYQTDEDGEYFHKMIFKSNCSNNKTLPKKNPKLGL
jgi:hypothetical protein